MSAVCNANSRAQTPFGERGKHRVSAMVLFDNTIDTETDTDFLKTDKKTDTDLKNRY